MAPILKDDHSLALLDFFRQRESLSGYCVSEEGRALILESLPTADSSTLERAKEELSRLVARMEESEPPEGTFPPIAAVLALLRVQGAVPEITDFYALGLWAKEYERLFAWARGRNPDPEEEAIAAFDVGELSEAWDSIHYKTVVFGAPRLSDVSRIVFDILTPDGELRDLPELQRIRGSIQRVEREILKLTESFRSDPEIKPWLQSGEPTQRDGRTVLAVKANFRGRIKGIVHEVSATGQTVFIEPGTIVERNNALARLESELRAEIAKILRRTAEKLVPLVPLVDSARSHAACMDSFLARARQLRREGLVLAGSRDAGLTLWRARHPLLGAKAVPVDVDLPDETRTLIITGPNTGGKTVTLKTLGLFALLNQFACGIRAAEGSSLPVFDAVMADIGDEQSIDQSLSTFSGHMKVISNLTVHASPRSLVLLDELGAGTDPEEGCALAMGLLDFFIERRSLAIVTTHHGILKNYGYTRAGCLNASMEFDAALFAPTYRIVMGIPGESRALEIAGKIGLSSEIVDKAKRYLDEERTDVGELILELTQKRRELDSMRRTQEAKSKQTAEDRRRLDLESLRVRQREHELKRQGLGELHALLQESRKTLENLVRELRESGISTEKTREVKAFLSDLADSAERSYAELEAERAALGARLASSSSSLTDSMAEAGILREGAYVLVRSTGKSGKLIRRASAKKWIVEIGSIRLTVSESDLAVTPGTSTQGMGDPKPSYAVELAPRDPGAATGRAQFELDLRGSRLSEALAAVERQIDAANLQGLSLFSIIHGTGEGVLGKGIHEFLKQSPSVADYHFARPEEGGFGKTYVRLKS